MGTTYHGICFTCKKYIDLDKFFEWDSYKGADHSTIQMTDLEKFKTNFWIYRALRLHIFLSSHNGHKIGVYPDNEIDIYEREFKEQYPWPTSLSTLTEKIDMAPSVSRLIINTALGEIFIDDRKTDINCFRFINGNRIDTILLGK